MKKILQLSIIFLLLAKYNFGHAQIFVPEEYSAFNSKLGIHFLKSDKFSNSSDVYDPLTLLDQLAQKLALQLQSNQIVEGSINHFTTSKRNRFNEQISDLFFTRKDTTLEYRTNSFTNFLNDYQIIFSEFEEIVKNKKTQQKNSEIENIHSSIYLAKGIMQGMKEILVKNPDYIFYVTDTTWGQEFKYLLIDFQKLKTDPYLIFFSRFSEDVAYVKWRGKYGFINSELEVFIDYQYDDANLFNSGKAIVSKLGKSYFIDKKNKGEVCDNLNGKPIQSWKATDGVTVVKQYTKNYKEEYFLLDNSCKIISANFDKIEEFSKNLLLVTTNRKNGLIDKKGKVLLEPIYDKIESEGDFIIYKTADNKKGILSNTNKYRFSKKDSTYDWIFGYEEKFLLLEKKDKMTLIDLKLQKKLPFVIDDIEPFDKHGLASFKKDGLWGLLNRDFKVILKPDYESIGSFNEKGFAILNNNNNNSYKKDNIVSVVDTKGKFLSYRKYSKIDDFHSEYAKVYFYDKKHGKELVGLVDSTWREIIPPIYEKLGQPQYDLIVGTRQDSTSSAFKEYPTIAYNDVVYDMILKKEVLPFQYIFSSDYGVKYSLERSFLYDQRLLFIPAAENEYSFANSKKIQYFVFDIEKRSKISTTSKINSVNPTTKKDIFLVKDIEDKYGINGKYGLISITDKETVILPCAYDSIYFKSNYYVVSELVSYYSGVHKFGIVDSLNNILVPIEFDFIKEVKNNCFIVEKNKANRKLNGVYNFNSFNVVPVLFDDCILGSESIIVKKDDEKFVIDYKGSCLSNCEKFKEILTSN